VSTRREARGWRFIADTGGYPGNDSGEVFDPFTTKKVGKGTGQDSQLPIPSYNSIVVS
jgi:hypothetical protein